MNCPRATLEALLVELVRPLDQLEERVGDRRRITAVEPAQQPLQRAA